MRIIEFANNHAAPIELFNSVGASSVRLGEGKGEAHAYCVYIEPGGSIGEHPTGFAQLFLIVHGSGWVAGADGTRVQLACGQGAFLERGELHAKGSEDGMTAIMIQVSELTTVVGP